MDKFEKDFWDLKVYGVEIPLVQPIWSLDLIACPLVEEQVAGFDANVIDITLRSQLMDNSAHLDSTKRTYTLKNACIQVTTFHEYHLYVVHLFKMKWSFVA